MVRVWDIQNKLSWDICTRVKKNWKIFKCMLVLKTKLYLQINYNSPCLRIFSVSENSQLPKLIIFSFSSVSCTIKEAHYWTARHKSLCLMLSLGKGRETEGNLRYPQILHSHWLFCISATTRLLISHWLHATIQTPPIRTFEAVHFIILSA